MRNHSVLDEWQIGRSIHKEVAFCHARLLKLNDIVEVVLWKTCVGNCSVAKVAAETCALT